MGHWCQGSQKMTIICLNAEFGNDMWNRGWAVTNLSLVLAQSLSYLLQLVTRMFSLALREHLLTESLLLSKIKTRNTLDCDQSNYSSRIVFSHTLIEFGPTRNSTIRSADLENPTARPNTESIRWSAAKISPFEFSKMAAEPPPWIWSNRK